MFVRKTGAYPSGTLEEAPEFDRLLALPTNIRLGWKGHGPTLQLITIIHKLQTLTVFQHWA